MKTPPGDLVVAVAVAVATAFGAAMPGAARAAPDATATSAAVLPPSALDLEARELFRSQRYADALAIYQRLRTETRHPTYLRNIGRCHQMMRQPTPAIDAFQAYLRDARDLDPAERAEIEGYIAEMRRLELIAPPPSNGGGGGTLAATPAPTASTHAATGATAAPTPAGGSSITRKWWFWTGIGVLAAATTGIIVAASSGQDRLPCPTGSACP